LLCSLAEAVPLKPRLVAEGKAKAAAVGEGKFEASPSEVH
jgi:hypothetical protein